MTYLLTIVIISMGSFMTNNWSKSSEVEVALIMILEMLYAYYCHSLFYVLSIKQVDLLRPVNIKRRLC